MVVVVEEEEEEEEEESEMRCTEDLRWARPWSDMARPALECRNAASEQGAGVSQRDTMVQ